MVDIHSHILPGLDDGAETLEEAVAMLRLAAESGTTDIVASPHANFEYTFQPELIEQKIAELTAAVDASIRIHRACDFHLSYDNIQDALAHPGRYTINHKNYLLVEFSDLLIPHSSGDVFGSLQAAGMVPVITHPERNGLLRQRLDKLEAWAESGCLLQVTALSFLGRFGKHAKAFADLLLERNLVHIVASDAHDTQHRPPLLREAYEYVRRKRGPARAEALFAANPRATLTGDPLPPEEVAPAPARKWYRLWK
ncbi:MAG: exopolysaccharide biosynthesis protein [Candidatus Solibacter usitatus]|nr:exopolysaccharide biosynthesis protein [Candidatus Solibacter usitatus]